jgi:hypothetical protein
MKGILRRLQQAAPWVLWLVAAILLIVVQRVEWDRVIQAAVTLGDDLRRAAWLVFLVLWPLLLAGAAAILTIRQPRQQLLGRVRRLPNLRWLIGILLTVAIPTLLFLVILILPPVLAPHTVQSH